MTDRDVHLPVAAQPSVETIVEQTRLAEDLGYDRAWLPETWGRDAVTALTMMGDRTETIGVGSSIMNVYSRSPGLLGQTAVTQQEVSDGRFRLGIGPSGPIVIESWHGEEFGNPLKRAREAVEIIKLVTTGQEVDYEGRVFDLSGFRLRSEPPEVRPPVDVAAMGPKAVEMAGRFADGWHATMFTPDGLRDRLGDFEHGGDLGDQDRDEQRTVLSLTACALDDGERARTLARQHAAFYVGGMGTYYRDSLARQGYEDRAHEIAAAWGSGNHEAAAELVDDEMLDDLAAAGTPEQARQRLLAFEEIDGLDAVAVAFPRGADRGDVEETMRALAPA
ncbi:MAG: TIGR04024 family LLM class F420-dependent oxidoreductase [Halobacteriales archaeon]